MYCTTQKSVDEIQDHACEESQRVSVPRVPRVPHVPIKPCVPWCFHETLVCKSSNVYQTGRRHDTIQLLLQVMQMQIDEGYDICKLFHNIKME